MTLTKRIALLTLTITIGLMLPLMTSAQSNEYQVKSAFLLNFAKLVEWPETAFASTDSPVVVGILGDEAFTAAAATGLGSKQVGKRAVELRRLSSAGDARSCHLVFVSRAHAESQGDILSATRGRPSLTIGDDEGFVRKGGTIAFYDEGGKVRFAVNVGVAEGTGLRISSRLLGLAKIVGK